MIRLFHDDLGAFFVLIVSLSFQIGFLLTRLSF
jgi:hypothetical protein